MVVVGGGAAMVRQYLASKVLKVTVGGTRTLPQKVIRRLRAQADPARLLKTKHSCAPLEGV